jgi:hypothetical protein
MASSFDALRFIKISCADGSTEQPLCVVEMITSTNVKTTKAAVQMANQVGDFQLVNVINHAQFSQLIPNASHRVQIVHHMAVVGARYGLYVVSSLGSLESFAWSLLWVLMTFYKSTPPSFTPWLQQS